MTAAGTEWTHPDTFTFGVLEGWADWETDPTEIDWSARQAAAAIPFEVVDGRPVNPVEETTIWRGRNQLGRWGENLMADALVTAQHDGHRWLLMVERGDGYGWAVPGGKVEDGESLLEAAARELGEETGLDLPAGALEAGAALYVPDPRASREAWAVTVPARAHLTGLPRLPEVAGADDARRAAWLLADSYADLTRAIDALGGVVFPAHVDMLKSLLDT